jgi:hypothetical protein
MDNGLILSLRGVVNLDAGSGKDPSRAGRTAARHRSGIPA